MDRIHYLAAEIFSYSYDNYENHLGGNARFDRLMPEDARVLDAALDGPIDVESLKKKLKVDEDELISLLDRTKEARRIVDAPTPASAFREGVKQSIEYALKNGLSTERSIDELTTQICYRAADLSFVLKERDEPIAKYSEELRHVEM